MISLEKPLNTVKGLWFHYNVVCEYCVSDNNGPIVHKQLDP